MGTLDDLTEVSPPYLNDVEDTDIVDVRLEAAAHLSEDGLLIPAISDLKPEPDKTPKTVEVKEIPKEADNITTKVPITEEAFRKQEELSITTPLTVTSKPSKDNGRKTEESNVTAVVVVVLAIAIALFLYKCKFI